MTRSASPIDIQERAEWLVVEGVRRYMTGFSTGDISCWEMAWDLYVGELGKSRARRPVSELSCYTRALNTYGARHFCLFPYECKKLCQDECLLAALVAAAQVDDPDAVARISAALVAEEGLEETIFAATEFAASLKDCGLLLKTVDLSSMTLDECPLKKLNSRFHH
ncbi:hypothetical protein [Labrenzia sp. CE80]|uniref:hypothetical protein n=1 Tax=Labrenzia sp. CE80 TaxID=1788986 RepID=UPI00129AB3D1|nr:hypothetical protein [Labrenzia sp. CE80]